ncbi:MAG: hypothetical protein ACYTBX_14620 [Planctomycetota bacterium]|jgi:hypothetical protein
MCEHKRSRHALDVTVINTGALDATVVVAINRIQYSSFETVAQLVANQSEWWDIWVTTGPTKDDPWGQPVNLGPTINTWMSESEPELSAEVT